MATLQQREELHRTIWSMADELRGAVGGWEFKAYVLGKVDHVRCVDAEEKGLAKTNI